MVKFQKLLIYFLKKLFDPGRKNFIPDYTSIKGMNIPSFIEICDTECHGLDDLTGNDLH